jgi:hypothetical protein
MGLGRGGADLVTARHFFPSADEMRGMLSPVARDAEAQLGSLASFFTVTRVKRADGTFGPSPPVSTGATKIPIKLTSVTLERAQEIFGIDTDVRMTAKTSRAEAIAPGMIVTVTDGDFAGQSFEVTQVVERPLSDSYVLGLKEHAVVS